MIEVMIEEEIKEEILMKIEDIIVVIIIILENMEEKEDIIIIITKIGIKEIKAIVRLIEDIIIIETEEDLDLKINYKKIKKIQKVNLEVAQNHKSRMTLIFKKKEEAL